MSRASNLRSRPERYLDELTAAHIMSEEAYYHSSEQSKLRDSIPEVRAIVQFASEGRVYAQ